MRHIACCLLAVLGCNVEHELVRCANNLLCPAGTVCDDAHASCATPEQLTACEGRDEDADCLAGAIEGGCFDGVCIARGCGNRIVEPSEQCDDGNQSNGDGCRSDCRSDERCGNGIVDAEELCDDGNLLSRDRCDSRCRTEDVRWNVHPVLPLTNGLVAFDDARDRLVLVMPRLTWEWDGTSWSATPTELGASQLYYDPSRGRVQATVASVPPTLAEWTGTSWVTRPTSPGSASSFSWLGIYDSARARTLIVGGGETFAVDANGTWTTLGAGPGLRVLAVDPQSGNVIGLAASGNGVAIYDGTAWTETSSTAVVDGAILVHNAARNRLWLIGGRRSDVFEWSDGTFVSVPAAAFPDSSTVSAAFDSARGRIVALALDALVNGEVLEWDGTTWLRARIPFPPLQPIAMNPDREGFMLQAAGAELWTWDGAWHSEVLSTAPAGLPAHLIYDPKRGAVIGFVSSPFGTWSYRDHAWSLIGTSSPASNAADLTFDPSRGRPVFMFPGSGPARPRLAELLDDGSWGEIPTTAAQLIMTLDRATSVAWSARGHVLTAITRLGNVYDFIDGAWTRSVSPGPGWTCDPEPRTGSVLYLPVNASPDGSRALLRTGEDWQMLADVPIVLATSSVAHDSRTGITLIHGSNAQAIFTIEMSFGNGSPLETCAAGEPTDDDADGDGVDGCDDPDCFWACTPACPPFTTCP